MSSKCIGIDLGTVNSCVAIWKDDSAEVIVNTNGNRTTPSVVGLNTKTKEWLVGDQAKRQQITNSVNTVHSAKRFIGSKFKDLGEEIKRVSYKVENDANGNPIFNLDGQKITPEEIGSKVIQNLKKAAEEYLGEKITKAVITVPAFFNSEQRQATKNAGEICGLEVLRVIAEPTAACLAYKFDKQDDQIILVKDFGGGTLDQTIVEISGGIIEVMATNGDCHLGGNDLDNALVDYLAEEFLKTDGIDLRKDCVALQRLQTEAEKVKKDLSSILEAEINIPFITADVNGPKHLVMKITRSKFEQLIAPFIDRVFECTKKVLEEAKLTADQIDEVIFVGGSTRIPMVYERTKKMFNKEPNMSVNPDEIVAIGAALQGALLTNNTTSDLLLLDVVPLDLGVETLGSVASAIIARNTTIPASKSQIFSTAADLQPSVSVRVCQGNRRMFADNTLLGSFNLEVAPEKRGIPQIEIKFDIDVNGIVNVSAKDLATGKDKTITIKSGLSNEEVARMVKEAEENAAQDEKKAAEIVELNGLDSLVFSAERMLKENTEQLTGYDTKDLLAAIEAAQRVIKERKFEEIKVVKETLTNATHKAAEYMYSRQPQPEPSAEPFNNNQEEDVIDVQAEQV